MKLLIIFIFLFSSQSFAKNKVQFLLEEKSDTSAFEILAQFHNKGDGQPVGLDELNTINL